MTYSTIDRNTRIARDVSVMSCAPAPNSGTAGTAIDFLGVFESMEFSLKRDFADTTGAADGATYSRATRWGKGSVKLTGYSRSTASKFAAIFAANSHAVFSFTESATGDTWQFVCTCDDFSKAVGKDATKDTLSLGQEDIPLFGPAGGALSAMILEA